MSHPAKDTRRELEALVTHLQDATELRDTALSHELHDELGALMGAALMDLDALRRYLAPLSPLSLDRLDRVKKTLEQAIDLKRHIIEELRPSILDNFGLFAALRWQLKKSWANTDVVLTQTYPALEPSLEPPASIALFRIAQGALSIALKHAAVKSSDLTVSVETGRFSMRFSDDGTPNRDIQTEDAAMTLASMRHRIRMFGGKVNLHTSGTTTVLTAWMPLH